MAQARDYERTDTDEAIVSSRQLQSHARKSIERTRETVERCQKLIEQSRGTLDAYRPRYP